MKGVILATIELSKTPKVMVRLDGEEIKLEIPTSLGLDPSDNAGIFLQQYPGNLLTFYCNSK